MTASPLRVAALVFVGTLLTQVSWILALPPFRGADEFDHAYRATAVARGQWAPPPSAATTGTGAVLHVPQDVVEAAGPVCHSMNYTDDADCEAQETVGDGLVAVASGAGRYNPLYYWVVGTTAIDVAGTTSLYVMRLATALLNAALLALAGWVLALSSRTRWPLVSLYIGLTPVGIYSMSVVAPNGLELAAAIVVWSCVLGLSRTPSKQVTRRLLWSLVPGAAVLVTVRSLGPLWLALIGLAGLWILRAQFKDLVRCHPRAIVAVGAVVSIAGLASVSWIMRMRALELRNEPAEYGDLVPAVLQSLPIWMAQTIAAFPRRFEFAPSMTYIIWLMVGAALLIVAIAVATVTLRWAMIATAVVAAAIPVGITAATFDQFGAAWQGRYGLPLAIGLVLMAGAALERARWDQRLADPAVLACAAALCTAHVASVVRVVMIERNNSPLAGDPRWLMPEPWIPAVLVVLGWACYATNLWWFRTGEVVASRPPGDARPAPSAGRRSP